MGSEVCYGVYGGGDTGVMSESLEGIKVGDDVAEYDGRRLRNILRVERRTTLHVVCGGKKYRVKNGRQVVAKGMFSYIRVVQCTQERRDTFRVSVLSSRLEDVMWDKEPLEKLEEVAAIVWPGGIPE